MKKALLVVVLVLGVAGSRAMAFDQAAEDSLSREATARLEAMLLRRDAEWADLATKGKDIDKIVSYWTDDAVIIMPGQPIVEGKAAIRAYVAASFSNPVFKIHWKSSKVTFSPDGKMAYMPGTNEMTVPGPNGAPMTLHLRGVAIWRLDPDGQWRCVVDISNEEPGGDSKKG
jgi:ketosteroid isomerase-like protein